MGRIDDALRLSNVDVGRGTGAPASTPTISPWRFEQRDEDDQREPPEPAARPPGRVRIERTPPGASGHVPPWARPGSEPLERLVVSASAPPLLVEQFRSLAASLLSGPREHPIKSLVVTSPSPGDGKSHVAINLALTLSGSYRRQVLLIDADLRRPVLHGVFGLPDVRGLSEALNASVDERVGAVEVSDTLTLLPAGRPQPDPLGGLSSHRMKHIVEEAASRFDWVILDSPPVGVLADVRLVSETVDGVLLVVRAGVTPFPEVDAAADLIGHERILGIVLNAVDPAEIRGKGYYSHYYGDDRGRA